jgi:ATP-dependent DNA helicase RecG
MKIIEMLKSNESKTLEFKRDISSPEGILKTIVAFANTSGGTLLVGIEDRTRNVYGVKDPLEVEIRLANLIVDRISPRIIPDIEILPWRSTHILKVNIPLSSQRPHALLSSGDRKLVFVRIGSTNRKADENLIAELSRSVMTTGYDEEPLADLNSEDIDFRAASELFEPVRKLSRKDLLSLKLVTLYQGNTVPTVGGILLFGEERLKHFPDAWIHVGRFAGRSRSSIVDQRILTSGLVSAITESMEFVKKHSLLSAEIEDLQRFDRWSIPVVAIREALVNAVVHADYSQQGAPIRVSIFQDRIEIENPGLLPFGLTIEDLRNGVSKLRNRVIGRVFHILGLIEQWGSGIGRMTEACHKAGLQAPILEEIGVHFRVTFMLERVSELSVEDKDQTILDALAGGEGMTTSEIAGIIELSSRATRTRLLKLIELGLVIDIGTSPKDPRRKYYLAGS